jgi:hypothetical protein
MCFVCGEYGNRCGHSFAAPVLPASNRIPDYVPTREAYEGQRGRRDVPGLAPAWAVPTAALAKIQGECEHSRRVALSV